MVQAYLSPEELLNLLADFHQTLQAGLLKSFMKYAINGEKHYLFALLRESHTVSSPLIKLCEIDVGAQAWDTSKKLTPKEPLCHFEQFKF